MSQTLSPSTNRKYGRARVLCEWELSRSTFYARQQRARNPIPPQRRGPKTAHTDTELTEAIREEITASPFHGEGHRKLWARLRFRGIRTSKTRVLRLMRENQLLAPSASSPPYP